MEFADQFLDWWVDLTTEQQAALEVRVELLAERGPSLGRPAVERIATSRHHNMKELRASAGGALRVLFML
ncbi:MAG: type II toxin-antitoxin system RelE/ParE family toxin, partial [Egibacteraceae bacterium]